MARIRTDFVRGTLTNALSSGDTTMTASLLASIPEIVAPDIAVIILDPLASAPEIVHITAHTAAATTATILRGRESSTARAHIAGTAWAHGATGDDFPANAFPATAANGDLLYGVAASDEYVALAKPASPAGDLLVFASGNAPSWLAPGSAGRFLRVNLAGTGLEYAEVPTIISADAFEWGTKVANRYTANFASHLLQNNAVFGDLLDVGWTANGTSVGQVPTTVSTGDLDSASDVGEQFITIDTDLHYWCSPKIVGGKTLLDDIQFHTGTRPTKVTVRIVMQCNVTTDMADTSGVGVSHDADLSLGFSTSGYFITMGATNFELWDGTTATDLGVAKDTSAHNFDIEITFAAATYRVLIDGTERKAAAAINQDVWPMLVKSYHGATGGKLQVFSYGVKYE